MSNIIVTGAGTGIGYHACLSLLKDSKNKVVAISRTKANLEKLEKAAGDLPGSLHVLSYDVTNYDYRALDEVLNKIGFKEVDTLINNAAVLVRRSFMEHKAEDYRSVMEVNYIGPAMLVRHLKSRLELSKGAHVLNVSSVAGVQGSSKFPGIIAYSGSKAAIISLTECLAQEFAETAIRVNAVCFGAVDTKMLRDNFPGYEAPVSDAEAGTYLADIAINGRRMYNGKIIVASVATPY